MRRIADYRRHAEECRTLARQADSPEERGQLLNMAATWESLAQERESALASGLAAPVDGEAVAVRTLRPEG
jgi:hypothetical protein